MNVVWLVATMAAAVPGMAGETKLGAGVALKEPTAIASLLDRPADYVGKTVRIDGVATAVCTEMGCWMSVAAEGKDSGKTVRLKVEDGAIVFPVSAKGKKVSAEGVFEAVGDPHGRAAAGEHARQDARATAGYHLKATGALIR